MGWSTATMRLVDEVTLQSSEELAGIIGARLNRNAPYASEFRISAIEILDELWPADDGMEMDTYLTLVSRDVDSMPVDLLEDLSAALMNHAKSRRASDPPTCGAANLIAGWLKVRCVEMRSEGTMRAQAMRLKVDHTSLIRQALVDGASVQAEFAL